MVRKNVESLEKQVVWGKITDRERILDGLRRAAAGVPLRQVYLLENTSGLEYQEQGVQICPAPRVQLVLSGHMHCEGHIGGRRLELQLVPGEAVFCPAYCRFWPRWDQQHEIISLVFYKTYLRVIYINHCTGKNFPEPDYYYHSRHPESALTWHLLKGLNLARGDQPEYNDTAVMLVQALLLMAQAEFRDGDEPELSKAAATRQRILNYIQSNCHLPINRESVAAELRLSPTYLSRILSRYDDRSFNWHLTDCRMQRAEDLLVEETHTIDEIAYLCGFRYTSYFIAVFEKHHQMSPCQYRVAKRADS